METINKVKAMFSIDKELVEKLRLLSRITRINKSELVREALRDLFTKYAKELKKHQ